MVLSKNLRQIHLRDSHAKFTGKIKLAIPCEQNYPCSLVKNSKTGFSKPTQKFFLLVSGEALGG